MQKAAKNQFLSYEHSSLSFDREVLNSLEQSTCWEGSLEKAEGQKAWQATRGSKLEKTMHKR